MSMEMVAHVREKSQSRGSARTLLLDLAIYANDCCGVAWPADATLRQNTNVSHQRIHELKNTLEDTGELVIVERPGSTNLYFVAWQGKPLGGTPLDTRDGHDPIVRCGILGWRSAARPREERGQTYLRPRRPGGSQVFLRPRGQRFLRGGVRNL